jgi:DNA-binding ferritin-like protein
MPTRDGTRDSSKSKSKKIVETISFQIVTSGTDHSALLEQMIVDYHESQWCELPILLSCLRALAFTHQMSHWTSSGDPFYGDHLLFERLYDGVVPEIDTVAEKAVGMGGSIMLHPIHQANHEALLINTMCGQGTNIPNAAELSQRSYQAEMHFMGMLNALVERMKNNGCWSIGVENMLGEIADKHEGHIYLLKQRVAG